MRTRESMAWAAGIFEGEGCFLSHMSVFPRAQVKMTDLDVIERVRDIIGIDVPIHSHLTPSGKTSHLIQYTNFEHAQAVMAMLWPWLCGRRRTKIREVLATFHSRPPSNAITGPKAVRYAR